MYYKRPLENQLIAEGLLKALCITFKEFGENLRNFGARARNIKIWLLISFVILAQIVPLIHRTGLIHTKMIAHWTSGSLKQTCS